MEYVFSQLVGLRPKFARRPVNGHGGSVVSSFRARIVLEVKQLFGLSSLEVETPQLTTFDSIIALTPHTKMSVYSA